MSKKSLLIVLAVLLAVSIFFNVWLLSTLKENTLSPENDWSPRGSYLATCRDCNFDGNTLSCSCLTRNQNWRNTSLDVNNEYCRSASVDIENDDGQLRCMKKRFCLFGC